MSQASNPMAVFFRWDGTVSRKTYALVGLDRLRVSSTTLTATSQPHTFPALEFSSTTGSRWAKRHGLWRCRIRKNSYC